MKFVALPGLLVMWLAVGAVHAEPPPSSTRAPGADQSPDTATATSESLDLRRASLGVQNSLGASSGLLRLSGASSGAAGTFRISLITNFYSGSGFLCKGTASGGCQHLDRNAPPAKDQARRLGANLGFSVTPWDFLEGYLGFRSRASYDNQNQPRLLQALGDANLGIKAFAPFLGVMRFGGQADIWLLSDAGNVGVTSAATSYSLRGLATMDLSRPGRGMNPVPLRAHLNLGWYFDNSSSLVTHNERVMGEPINRIERFGLGVNRLDSLDFGLGVEGVWEVVHPFLEWSIDVPEARQRYTCNRQSLEPGDECLKRGRSFSSTPSRVGFGARFFPGLAGLAITGALEVGTGATSKFLQEVVPELPWSLYLGVGYAVDTVSPKPVVVPRVQIERVVEVSKPVHRTIVGRVIDQASGNPVPRAVLEYDGRDMTGMVAGDNGTFKTLDLEPGVYRFKVNADGYRAGECQATVPADPNQTGDKAAAVGPDGSITVSLECGLEALPKLGTITGTVVDAATGAPVSNARLKIKDNLGRELNLTASETGGFRFEQVPPGAVKLVLEAPDYLPGATTLELKPREDLTARVNLNHQPKKATVRVTPTELKLERPIQFRPDSVELVPESLVVVQEIAELLRKRTDIRLVEVQGHTDDAGSATDNRRLSQQRADAVRDALVDLGVEAARLSPNGYGPDKPLVANTSDANRTKNRRIQLMILQKLP